MNWFVIVWCLACLQGQYVEALDLLPLAENGLLVIAQPACFSLKDTFIGFLEAVQRQDILHALLPHLTASDHVAATPVTFTAFVPYSRLVQELGCQSQPGKAFAPGEDLQAPFRVPSARHCCYQCNIREECTAWQFNNNNGDCQVKYRIPPERIGSSAGFTIGLNESAGDVLPFGLHHVVPSAACPHKLVEKCSVNSALGKLLQRNISLQLDILKNGQVAVVGENSMPPKAATVLRTIHVCNSLFVITSDDAVSLAEPLPASLMTSSPLGSFFALLARAVHGFQSQELYCGEKVVPSHVSAAPDSMQRLLLNSASSSSDPIPPPPASNSSCNLAIAFAVPLSVAAAALVILCGICWAMYKRMHSQNQQLATPQYQPQAMQAPQTPNPTEKDTTVGKAFEVQASPFSRKVVEMESSCTDNAMPGWPAPGVLRHGAYSTSPRLGAPAIAFPSLVNPMASPFTAAPPFIGASFDFRELKSRPSSSAAVSECFGFCQSSIDSHINLRDPCYSSLETYLEEPRTSGDLHANSIDSGPRLVAPRTSGDLRASSIDSGPRLVAPRTSGELRANSFDSGPRFGSMYATTSLMLPDASRIPWTLQAYGRSISSEPTLESLQQELDKQWVLDDSAVSYSRRIGQGAYGDVWVGKWNGTLVAVKSLLNKQEAISKQFESEVRIMSGLRHPNVVLFMGVMYHPPAVVMEYCTMGSLHRLLGQVRAGAPSAPTLDWRRKLTMIHDAAKGMAYLHSRRPAVLHRDLKSPNLLVDSAWRVKVSDFGLSTYADSDSSVAHNMTNPRWTAPEVMRGGDFTTASDVFSFGIIMWELLTAEEPYSDATSAKIMTEGMVHELRPKVPPLHAVHGGMFDGLQDYIGLMTSCWASDPLQRPSFVSLDVELRTIRRKLSMRPTLPR